MCLVWCKTWERLSTNPVWAPCPMITRIGLVPYWFHVYHFVLENIKNSISRLQVFFIKWGVVLEKPNSEINLQFWDSGSSVCMVKWQFCQLHKIFSVPISSIFQIWGHRWHMFVPFEPYLASLNLNQHTTAVHDS